MSEPRIAALYRYPVKGLSPESLPSVRLRAGETIPLDRAYAIENGASGFDPLAPRHLPKIRYLMLMKNGDLAGLDTRLDPLTRTLTIRRDGAVVAEGCLETEAGRAVIEAFFAAAFPGDLRGPPKVLGAEGFSFSDVARKVLHVVNLDTLRDLERWTGRPIDPLRLRANVYVEGVPAWSELDWIGRTLVAPRLRLKAVKRTERCAATNVDPATGARDMEIPRTLMGVFGHTDCGIYVSVDQAK